MFTTPYNQRTRKLKLQRIEVCDILLALTTITKGTDAEKWKNLHDKVKEQLDAQDLANPVNS